MAKPQYRFLVISDDQHHRRSAAAAIVAAEQPPPIQISLRTFRGDLESLGPLHCIFVSFSSGDTDTARALEGIEQRYSTAAKKPLVIVLADKRYRAEAETSLKSVPHEPHAYLTFPLDHGNVASILEQVLGNESLLEQHRT